ncbi:MAG: prevent-host-death family protein [Pseudonocardiales bacterium]|nr:MAG: prevent-host-death family protein [Pseudonocardiales bacterium]
MAEIPLRELRNDTSGVLRRVEGGERFTVTVSGRPVAQLIPLPRRRRFIPWDEFRAMMTDSAADPGLLEDLHEMMPETTDDIEDPWERAAQR